MPKAATNATAGVAAAVGIEQARSADPIQAISTQIRRYPGQRGVLAIDPGDKHIGMAAGRAFAPLRDGKVPDGAEDELDVAFELGYVDALFTLNTAIDAGWVDLLVVERFTLYEEAAPALVGSDLLTSQFIGAATWMVRRYNRWLTEVDTGREPVELYLQPASLQETTKSVLRNYQIGRTSKPGQGHALSAELHWWYCVLQQRGLLGDARGWLWEGP